MTEIEYVYDIAKDEEEVRGLQSWINSEQYWASRLDVRIAVYLRIAYLKYRMKNEVVRERL